MQQVSETFLSETALFLLTGASLSEAALTSASRTAAIVTQDHLLTCRTLRGTTLPDGTTVPDDQPFPDGGKELWPGILSGMDTQKQESTHIAQQLAAHLGETEKPPRAQIRRIVQTIGPARTQAFVDQALAVDASGGMLVPDGSRKRTLGGVFFRLVRDQVAEAERRAIWPPPSWQQRTQRPKAPAAPAPAPLPPFQWEQAAEVIAAVIRHPGAAATVKVTLIGRPGEIVERQGVIILALSSTAAPSLPKGLPALPQQPTNYLVFVSQKQWKRVADALQNPEDTLIVEGYPVQHPRFTGITMYATQVTTTHLQAAKRPPSAR